MNEDEEEEGDEEALQKPHRVVCKLSSTRLSSVLLDTATHCANTSVVTAGQT